MALSDLIQAKAADLKFQLQRIDEIYAAERAAILAQLQALREAAALITPELQAAVDKLGVIIQVGK